MIRLFSGLMERADSLKTKVKQWHAGFSQHAITVMEGVEPTNPLLAITNYRRVSHG